MTEPNYLPMGDYAEVEIDRPVKATSWMSGEEFFVGDIVSRDGSDLHRVIEIVTEDLIVVECIREPEGWLNDDGTRDEPWCRLGEIERNLTRRYHHPDELKIDGTASDRQAGLLTVPQRVDLNLPRAVNEPPPFVQALFNAWLATAIRPCICCSEPFISSGTDNVVCSSCRASAPEFDQRGT